MLYSRQVLSSGLARLSSRLWAFHIIPCLLLSRRNLGLNSSLPSWPTKYLSVLVSACRCLNIHFNQMRSRMDKIFVFFFLGRCCHMVTTFSRVLSKVSGTEPQLCNWLCLWHSALPLQRLDLTGLLRCGSTGEQTSKQTHLIINVLKHGCTCFDLLQVKQ